MKPKQSSGFAAILAVILAVVGLALIGAAYLKTQGKLNLPLSISSPIPTDTTDPTANWKTYDHNKVGFTIRAPSSLKTTINEDDSLLSNQDYVTAMSIVPAEESGGIVLNSIYIAYPITIKGPHKDVGKKFENGLEGLEFKSKVPNDMFEKLDFWYTKVDRRKALVTLQVERETPPKDFRGERCGCTFKHTYIDLGNNTILDILSLWQNSRSEFEKTFDQILSTFKFTK